MSVRDRFDGDVSLLVEVFVAVADGPTVCRYECEAEKTSKAVVITDGPTGIQGSHDLLKSLYAVQPNLSFTKATVDSALTMFLQQRQQEDKDAGTKS